MFIFKNKKKANSSSVQLNINEGSPKKSIESSLARALALENMLVAGFNNKHQSSKETVKKYMKVLTSSKISFTEKVNVISYLDFPHPSIKQENQLQCQVAGNIFQLELPIQH